MGSSTSSAVRRLHTICYADLLIRSGTASVPSAAAAATAAVISAMPTKTPISVLQEFCAQRGMTPTYDLIANEGK